MKVTFDETGYVNGWCMVGDNGGEEYDPPEDFDRFLDSFESFKLADGKLVFDSEKDDTNRLESEKASLRERREKECFSVVQKKRKPISWRSRNLLSGYAGRRNASLS